VTVAFGSGISICCRRSPATASNPSRPAPQSQNPCGRSSSTQSGVSAISSVAPLCPGTPPTGLSPFLRGAAAAFFSPSEDGGLLEFLLVFSTLPSSSFSLRLNSSNTSNSDRISASFSAWLIRLSSVWVGRFSSGMATA
jgi:hypothetical protein